MVASIEPLVAQGPLGCRIERAGRAFGLVERGGSEVLRNAHQQVARFGHVEARVQDRLERLFLLVAGDGREEFGMADLDAPLVEGRFNHLGKLGQRETAIELGPGPAKPTGSFGAITPAGGENLDRGVGLLGLRRFVADVVFYDSGFERFLIGQFADVGRDQGLGPQRFQAGAMAAFASHQLKEFLVVWDRPDEHRLQNTLQADRCDELVVLLPVEIAARVIAGDDLRRAQHRHAALMGICQSRSPSERWQGRRSQDRHPPDRITPPPSPPPAQPVRRRSVSDARHIRVAGRPP